MIELNKEPYECMCQSLLVIIANYKVPSTTDCFKDTLVNDLSVMFKPVTCL